MKIEEATDFFEVSVIGHDDAGLSLDGLAHEGAHVGVGEGLGQGGQVVEGDAFESATAICDCRMDRRCEGSFSRFDPEMLPPSSSNPTRVC